MTESEFINKYIGSPWVNRGEDVGGVDCWGLVLLAFREVYGIELPSISGYSDNYCHTSDAFDTADMSVYTEHSLPKNGRIMAIFNTNGNLEHVGVVLSNRVLHATRKLGVRLESCKAIINRNPIVRFYEYNG